MLQRCSLLITVASVHCPARTQRLSCAKAGSVRCWLQGCSRDRNFPRSEMWKFKFCQKFFVKFSKKRHQHFVFWKFLTLLPNVNCIEFTAFCHVFCFSLPEDATNSQQVEFTDGGFKVSRQNGRYQDQQPSRPRLAKIGIEAKCRDSIVGWWLHQSAPSRLHPSADCVQTFVAVTAFFILLWVVCSLQNPNFVKCVYSSLALV